VFTGHHTTGKAIARAAADHLVPVALELGGKSPQLVFDDADLDAALEGVLLGIFGAAGQMCIAGSRLFVHDAVHDEFVARLVARVEHLRVGDPRRDDVNVGPQTTAAQRDKSLAMIERALAEGAHRLAAAALPTDAALAGGYFVPPTVFADVEPEMSIMREEVFGPVLAVGRFSDERDALAKAQHTEFGLAAGIWTRDVGRAHRVAAALDVGTVWINTYRVLSDLVPFGGIGLSGYGREGGASAIELYTRTKSVWTSTAPGVPPGFRL
jgi:acyl-CoA reductase-like NAD-dependent aldehyde dehydrogenase